MTKKCLTGDDVAKLIRKNQGAQWIESESNKYRPFESGRRQKCGEMMPHTNRGATYKELLEYEAYL
jgi:hypothetical protein